MCASSAIAGTTLGGIRRIRSTSSAAIGQLARQRPTEPVAWTEAEAIRRAQAGDAAAFEHLFQLHSRRVDALCLRTVRNPADAEEEMEGSRGCWGGNSKSQRDKARTRLRKLLKEEIGEQARQERHAAKTQTGPSD